jgi:RES domain-containing protein
MTPHPDYDLLLQRMGKLLTRAAAFDGVVFRSTEPTYATKKDLLTGEGSRLYGGRWNPPGSFATVYAARSDVTAVAESKAHLEYYGFDPADAWPRTLVAIDIKLARVLDLTAGPVRQALAVSATRMRGDDWRALNRRRREESLTQAIGRAAYASMLEALLVPACDAGTNLVWFPGNLSRTSKATIRNVGKLR